MMFNTESMKASMSEDDFALIIDAILNGKYSWACVLILKNAGYEPGHYIPYRTLNRLIKENGFPSCAVSDKGQSRQSHPFTNRKPDHDSAKSIRDLNYLELSVNEANKVKGGHFAAWADTNTEIDSMSACSAWAF
ncbi:MAG: HetP family heterocyst commitment protein [Cyanobacteria bacterium P01_H01_bin.21]